MLGATASPKALGRAISTMGQVLLEPPSVEGWRGERDWLTSATWLVRTNFAADLFAGRRGFRLRPGSGDLLGDGSSEDRADAAVRLLLDGDVSERGRAAIIRFAKGPAAKGPGGAGAILHAVMNLPEAHLL